VRRESSEREGGERERERKREKEREGERERERARDSLLNTFESFLYIYRGRKSSDETS